MKIRNLIMTGLLTSASSAFAVTHEPLQNATALIFGAECVAVDAGQGMLQVRMGGDVDPGLYRSFVRASEIDSRTGELIPLHRCQALAEGLSERAGRRISIEGERIHRSYEASQPVWGTCYTGGGHIEREKYACQKGFRNVTLVERETAVDLEGTLLFLKNE